MIHQLWLLDYLKKIQDLALESLQEKITKPTDDPPTIDETLKNVLSINILEHKQSKTNENKFNEAIKNAFENYKNELRNLINDTFNKLSKHELRVTLQHNLKQEKRWETNNDSPYFFENLLLDIKAFTLDIQKLQEDNLYFFSTIEAINRLYNSNLLEHFKIGTDVKTEHYMCLFEKRSLEKLEKLNEILNNHFQSLVSLKLAYQNQQLDETIIHQKAYDASEKTRSKSRKTKVEKSDIERFVKNFVNGLHLDDKNLLSLWVDCISKITELFYSQLFESTNLFPGVFSDFFLHYVINGKIFEYWAFKQIAELFVPVVANAKYQHSSECISEYDLVAFIDDRIIIGDVTVSNSESEIKDKIQNLEDFSPPPDMKAVRIIVKLGSNDGWAPEFVDGKTRVISVSSFDDYEFRDKFYRAVFQ